MKTVKITGKDGSVVIQSTKTPEFGYLRVETSVNSFENGWLRSIKRSALIRGKFDQLSTLGLSEGSSLPGTIVRKESTKAFKPNQEPAINPKTNEILTHNGMPIYAENFYTENQNATDKLLSRDKVSVLTSVQGVSQESDAIN